MKLSLLVKQLERFHENGVTHGEVRLGFGCFETMMEFDVALKEIEKWVDERMGAEVAEGEISVKPVLPKCWDGNAI